ncbi:DUF3606 domain-containing protein [Aridibaculum aurantiacum]|uniref:DUF3606 domain-containing protein n=1 Tax=Aridibaculum aurantiacum TaxID=2810307 RepID=UPI001A960856|nr:DUF3606 domain-containing protein [Aridibaculum aurantiacum]
MDYSIKKPQDLQKINANEIGELLWWACALGTSPEKILAAISDVGESAEAVRRYINNL